MQRGAEGCQHDIVKSLYHMDDCGDTFRAVYTLRRQGSVYVLHAFQKKSKTARETPRRDAELIKRRLHEAERIAGEEKP